MLEQVTIKSVIYATSCDRCGCPLMTGDKAVVETDSDQVYCSKGCAQNDLAQARDDYFRNSNLYRDE